MSHIYIVASKNYGSIPVTMAFRFTGHCFEYVLGISLTLSICSRSRLAANASSLCYLCGLSDWYLDFFYEHTFA